MLNALNLAGIQNTLLDWIGGQTDLAIVWPGANDTAAPDSDAYLLARVTKLSKIGDDALVFPAPDDFDPYNPGAFSLIGNREITLALQGFRPGSLDALEDLRTSLDLPACWTRWRTPTPTTPIFTRPARRWPTWTPSPSRT